jgi:ankyrin repeat protein
MGGHGAIVELLLLHGANIHHVDNMGNTVLMLAAWDVHTEVVAFLLEKGANKYHENKKGQTAFNLAEKIVSNGKIIDMLNE